MALPDDLTVRRLPTTRRPGAEHMAFDAIAADRAGREDVGSVRVYGWQPSTLSLGYAQESETIDWSFCEQAGIHVTRRPTGGGAIYHDNVGDIAYSIVLPRQAVPGNLMECYHLLCEPVIEALRDMGVAVGFAEEARPAIHEPACYLRELNPSHDLVVRCGGTMRKISGNAQYRRSDAIVQHGSVTFRSQPEAHLSCFADATLDATEFTEHVTAIEDHTKISREEAVTVLERTLADRFDATETDWTSDEREAASELAERKFGAHEWIQDRADPMAEA